MSGIQIPNEFKERNVYFKVVHINNDNELVPCSGGDTWFRYKAPKFVDGAWVPGEWTEPTNARCCHSGYHVTTEPERWVRSNVKCQIFWAEARGYSSTDGDDKTAFESIRLLRPLTFAEVVGVDSTYIAGASLTSLIPRRILGLVCTLNYIREAAKLKHSYPQSTYVNADNHELLAITLQTYRAALMSILSSFDKATSDEVSFDPATVQISYDLYKLTNAEAPHDTARALITSICSFAYECVGEFTVDMVENPDNYAVNYQTFRLERINTETT